MKRKAVVPVAVSKRRKETGTVVSDKMQKTVVVLVIREKPHPLYKKTVKKRKRLKVHDQLGAKVGDKVRIEELRPISKEKRWKVLEIVRS